MTNHESRFCRSGSPRNDHKMWNDTAACQQAHEFRAIRIVADDADQCHLATKRRDVQRDIRGTSECRASGAGPQHRDRCFRRQAACGAAHVAVEHDVAEHQHARIAKTANRPRQFRIAGPRHRSVHGRCPTHLGSLHLVSISHGGRDRATATVFPRQSSKAGSHAVVLRVVCLCYRVACAELFPDPPEAFVKYLPPFDLIRRMVEVSTVRGELRVSLSYDDFVKILRMMISGIEVDEEWYLKENRGHRPGDRQRHRGIGEATLRGRRLFRGQAAVPDAGR